MQHFPQSLGPLRIESPMNGVWAARSLSECLFETFLVELVDGVARRLRVAAEAAGYLVGVLASVAGEQDPAERRKVKASGERKPAFRVSRSASLKGRAYMGRFMEERINLDYHLVWRCTS
jgi:hypothetical protein